MGWAARLTEDARRKDKIARLRRLTSNLPESELSTLIADAKLSDRASASVLSVLKAKA